MEHKPLAKEFKKNGFLFKQITRTGDVAIYSKRKPGYKSVSFEVIKISRHDGYEIAGVKMEPAECYPSNENWGHYGFTYSTEAEARARFEKMSAASQISGKIV